LSREQPDGGDRQRDETGLRSTCARSRSRKDTRHDERRNRDQAGNRQPTDDAKLPILRAEECAKAR
jgi:hypothetical protein